MGANVTSHQRLPPALPVTVKHLREHPHEGRQDSSAHLDPVGVQRAAISEGLHRDQVIPGFTTLPWPRSRIKKRS